MLGSEILEVAIGVIFIYMLVSVICSAIREAIEAKLKTRAAYLAHGIRELLHDQAGTGLAKSFYEHPLIYSLFAGGSGDPPIAPAKPGEKPAKLAKLARGRTLPSYIPSKNFALALMDMAVRGPATDAVSGDPEAPAMSLESVRAHVLNLQNPAVQRVMLTAIDSAQGDLDRAVANLTAWYDSGMDRVSGWYKRSTHWILFWVGLFIAVSLNVDTLAIADFLYRNDAARAAVVARAESAARDSLFATDSARAERRYVAARAGIDSLAIPMGWGEDSELGVAIKNAINERGSDEQMEKWRLVAVLVLVAIPGWLLTAFAATMGAPFWFDVLNKVMVIRSTVKPAEKSPPESSEDRQAGTKATRSTAPVSAPAAGEKPADTAAGAGAGAGAAATLAGAPPGAPPPPAPGEVSAPLDADSALDGCDVDMAEDEMPDEELPAAEGGVA